MNNLSNRLLSLAAVTTVAVLHSAGAVAAPKAGVPVFNDRAAANVSQLPALAKAQTGVVGTLNAAALSASGLELTLADGRKVTARLERVAKDSAKGTQSWIGTFDDSPGSILMLTKTRGVVSGFATVGTETFEIVPQAGGKHLLYAVDEGRLPKTSEPEQVAEAGDYATESGYGSGSSYTSNLPAGGVVHDVLVVYTPTSAAKYGIAVLESMIQSAVQAANQAYLNSQVGITMNLVGTGQVSFTEGSSMSATKSLLQSNTATANLRNQLGADIVMLVAEHSDYCGLASLMTSNSSTFAGSAYGVVASDCLSNQSLAHEVGHTQGLLHDRANTSSAGPYPYGYGYRRCTTDGTGFRDIMSYSCTGAARVLVFSNPYVTWNGYSAGIPYESDAANSAENARVLINTAGTVASFRSKATDAPAAPSSLSAVKVAYNVVGLAWTDNATNESGFKVERSGDGVTYSEIATLGAGARAYDDSSVSSLKTYYYRVRAYNGAGNSAYTSALGVGTPGLPSPPPAAPTNVAASNKGDGSAVVAWVDSSTNETKFEVRREKWDAKRSIWSGASVIGTLPSNLTSMVDLSGNGTFRYSVRAVNDGGTSPSAGPAPVTVTGGASKGRGGR